MKSDRTSRLRALVAQLESLIENHDAENAIIPGNGYNESTLIGSPDSFLRLAKVLVEIVSDAGEQASWLEHDMGEETIEGVSAIGTNRIKGAFHESSPVWVMCAYLASDAGAAKELAKRLSELVGTSGSV